MTGKPLYGAEIVAEVQALRAAGLSIRRIAERMGLPKSTVHWLLHHPGGGRPAGRVPSASDADARQVARTGPISAPAGPHPLRPDEPRDHPAARGLAGWVRPGMGRTRW